MATTSPSIKLIRASDGSGNASAATVQNTRSPGATTIQVDTVQGLPDNFYATMGTPHTFTDPVTGETITVISEATAVDFEGHVDGSNLEIDDIAAGYTDGGSSVGDIVVIRPTTPYANNIADVLDVSLNDDGTIKNDAISSKDMFVDALDPVLRGNETIGDFIASGGVVAQSAGLVGTFSNIVYYYDGVRYTANSIANKTYLASKDTYVDIGIDGVVDYNDVANGAAAPALAANHIRVAKVVTNGSAITSVIQRGYDSLGKQIYPNAAATPAHRSGGYRCGVIPLATISSTGNKAITGVGYKPKGVRFTMLITGTGMGEFGYGAMDDSGSQFATAGGAWGGGGAGQNTHAKTNRCIMYNKWQLSTTPLFEASFVSMDNDGFTINVDIASNDSTIVGVAWEAVG